MVSRDKRRSNVGFVMTEPRRDVEPATDQTARRDATLAAAPGSAGSAVPSIRALNAGLVSHSMPEAASAETLLGHHGERDDAKATSPPANVLPFQTPAQGQTVHADRETAVEPAVAPAERELTAAPGGSVNNWRDHPMAPGDAAQALVQALRAADLALAETLFGDLTGLSSSDVLRVLYAPGGEDLALACRALGLEQLQFVSIFIMTRKLGLGEEALDPKELARIVGLFEVTDPAEADQALASWRA